MVQLAVAKLEAAIEAFDCDDEYAGLAVRDAIQVLDKPALHHLVDSYAMDTREDALDLIAELEAAEL